MSLLTIFPFFQLDIEFLATHRNCQSFQEAFRIKVKAIIQVANESGFKLHYEDGKFY